MSGWRRVTIAQLAGPGPNALATGPFGSAISARNFVDEGVPVIRGSNLSLDVGVRLKDDELAFLTEAKASEFKRSVARRGDLVFTCWGTIGQIGLIDERSAYDEYIVSNKQMKLTPDPAEVDSTFLYYLLSSPEMVRVVTGQAIGAAVPGFNLGQLKDINVSLPPLGVQRQIAGVLNRMTDLIENNRRRVELLEQMARAIYREWFVKFRYPGHPDVPLVDSAFGPIPGSWRVQQLATIAKVNGSSRKPSADEVFTYLDISALAEREIGELDAIAGSEAPGRARRVLAPGDTVWATVRPNRRAHALVVAPGDDWIASTGLAVLTPTAVSSAFLFETTSTTAFSDWLVGRATGSAYPAVRAKDFEEALVVVPDVAVDAAFAQRVAPMHELSWKLRAECSALANLRDLLLPKLVTGQIDVSSLDLDALPDGQVA